MASGTLREARGLGVEQGREAEHGHARLEPELLGRVGSLNRDVRQGLGVRIHVECGVGQQPDTVGIDGEVHGQRTTASPWAPPPPRARAPEVSTKRCPAPLTAIHGLSQLEGIIKPK